ncbi:MAG: ATP-binding protein [Clostridia bacterium]|nr:ATP-binding protein [Clostridia bacterium]
MVFTLREVPDLTLASYSGESDQDVRGVLEKHRLFLRQIHRLSLLSGRPVTLVYDYEPSFAPGRRMQCFVQVDSGDLPEESVRSIMHSMAISPFFHLEECPSPSFPSFPCFATIARQDGFMASSVDQVEYYIVDDWKPNEEARLITLFQMMRTLNVPCCFAVTLKAVQIYDRMKRELDQQSRWIRSLSAGKIGAQRDENAEQCLRRYTKCLDDMRANPQFIAAISAFASSVKIAQLLLDSAASEAVLEGNYICKSYSCSGRGLMDLQMQLVEQQGLMCDEKLSRQNNPARNLPFWNTLYSLSQICPFFLLPVLFPNEQIELPKESAPVYAQDGLYLGKDTAGYDVFFPWKYLSRHALLAGVPGSGKTYSMLHLVTEMHHHGIPFLVLEPAKQEYRALCRREDMQDLLLFSPGSPNSFPLRINPFEFPQGMKLSEHIVNLRQVFEGTFDLNEGPLPMLIDEGLEEVYRAKGWLTFEINDGTKSYPRMSELYVAVERLLKSLNYSQENRDNLMTILQVRIGSLMKRDMGHVFDVPRSTLSPEKWLKRSCVIELESLGRDGSNFLTLLLATLIREYLKLHPGELPEDGSPKHVIFFEEAHNLIGPRTEAEAGGGNVKVASTQFIVNMLAEVRALGEAIVIADQLPTSLAPQVTKNTSLKIAHKITAVDDRQFIGSTMSIDGIQMEKLAQFTSGHALCIYEGLQKPFEIQIHMYEGVSTPPSNEELLCIQGGRKRYQAVMSVDAQIMIMKYAEQMKVLAGEATRLREHLIELLGKETRDVEGEKVAMLRLLRAREAYCACLLEVLNYAGQNRTAPEEVLKFYAKQKQQLGKLYSEVARVKSAAAWDERLSATEKRLQKD